MPLATPFVIVVLTFYLKHIYDKKERRHALRIEFNLDAFIHGKQDGFHLVEFITTIDNKSLIKHNFTNITLRVLGLKDGEDEKIKLWEAPVKDRKTGKITKKQTSRINFPENILHENILPPSWENIFVEPGVKQQITFPAPIPENIRYILATAKFHYQNVPKPHTAERMFVLKTSGRKMTGQ